MANNSHYRSVSSKYVKSYTSFSGHDMVCVFEMPLPSGGALSKVVGSLQSVTYSTNNNKTPVRNLGNMNARGYVFGPRTIAGTLVFTVFDRHWLREMVSEFTRREKLRARPLADEIPPLNITISMANEYGDKARLALYKVTFVNEGQVMSINDLYTENTFQFYALDIDYLAPIDNSTSNGTAFNKWEGYTYEPPDPNDPANKVIDNPEAPKTATINTDGKTVKQLCADVLKAQIYKFNLIDYKTKRSKNMGYREFKKLLEDDLKARDNSQAALVLRRIDTNDAGERALIDLTRKELAKQRFVMVDEISKYLAIYEKALKAKPDVYKGQDDYVKSTDTPKEKEAKEKAK